MMSLHVLAQWAPVGVETVVKATLLMLVVFPAALLLERFRATWASALVHALLLGLLALPLAVALAPRQPIAVLAAPHVDASVATPSTFVSGAVHGPLPSDETVSTGSVSAANSDSSKSDASTWSTPSGVELLVLAYLIGVLSMLIRLFAGWRRVSHYFQTAEIIDDLSWKEAAECWSRALGSTRPPTLRHSEKINSPATTGWFRPTVLVPSGLLSKSSIRDAVVLHESAHVRRGDVGWQFLLRLVQAVYWFHPLVWLLGRVVSRLREKACDAVCARALGSSTYRESLIAVAETMVVRRAGSMIAMADSCRLEDRLAFLDQELRESDCRTSASIRWGLSVLFAPALFLLAAVELVAVPSVAASAEQPEQGAVGEVIRLGGRVLLPDGTPASGASIVVRPEFWSPDNPPSRTTTADRDGRWSLSIPKKEIPDYGTWGIFNVWAWLPGFGLQGFRSHGVSDLANMETRLIVDRPIRGRFVDRGGKPISGLKVDVIDMVPLAGESLDPWLAGVRNSKARLVAYERDNHIIFGNRFVDFGVPQSTATDADGRFELRGFGVDRVVVLSAAGAKHRRQQVAVLNREGAAEQPPPDTNYRETQTFWNGFEAVLRPGGALRGVVRDRESGAPIPGVLIHTPLDRKDETPGFMWGSGARQFQATDTQGRFEVLGLPADSSEYRLLLEPSGESPYLPAEISLPPEDGGSLTVEAKLDRGILVQGTVVDDVDGHTVYDTGLTYAAFDDNPHRSKARGYKSFRHWKTFHGKFRIVVPPGRGVLAFLVEPRLPNRWDWDAATVSQLLGRDATKPIPNLKPEVLPKLPVGPAIIGADTHNKIVPLDLAPGSPPQTIKVTFVRKAKYRPAPGYPKDRKGIVVDSEGRPLAGVELKGAFVSRSGDDKSVEFVVSKLQKSQPRQILGIHREKKLAGYVDVSADDAEPVTLKLQPWGTIKGRLLGDDGKPLPAVFIVTRGVQIAGPEAHPDKDGRFQVEGLPAGLTFELMASANRPVYVGRVKGGVRLKPGETLDLGDVKLRGL